MGGDLEEPKQKEDGEFSKKSSHRSSRDGDRRRDRSHTRRRSSSGDEQRRSRHNETKEQREQRKLKESSSKDNKDKRTSRSSRSERHNKDGLKRSSTSTATSQRSSSRSRKSSLRRSMSDDGATRRSSRSERDKERHDRDKSDNPKNRDEKRRQRDHESRRHETREEREKRKKHEREDSKRQNERQKKRDKEREERLRRDEESRKKKEELRAERRKTKGVEEETPPSTLIVNRADLRSISKEKFNNVYSMGCLIYKGEDTRVHKCHHRATTTERCVKITPKKSSVCHEFDMLKEMDHPNILTMYDLFAEETETGFEWYLVIDLCKGKSLYHYLQKRSCKPDKEVIEEKPQEAEEDDMFGLGALMAAAEDAVNAVIGEEKEEIVIEEGEHYGLGDAEAKQAMLQVLSCVNYLHKNRLVHADIKPQNLIMATGADLSTLKMLDFDNSAHLRTADDKISAKKGTPEYMAPEVHAGNKYGYKCDIWSCGVMAYQLLSNSLPFGDTKQMTEEEIAARVEDGKYSMGGPAWGGVSDDAKDFVKSLLVLRDKQRPSAEKAILHRWLQGSRKIEEHASSEVIKLSEDKSAVAAMSNFRSFKADTKLKKATCAFIASQLLTKEEKDKIDSIFRTMDITRDGKLSKTEVKAGFYKVSGTLLSDKEIDDMFSRVDCDGTGEIEYSEFVIASMSETDLLSTNRLRKAFQLFDKDKGGSITTDELREIFSFFQTAGSDMDDAYVDKVIAQVDADGDGDVSFDEFCEMMRNGIPV